MLEHVRFPEKCVQEMFRVLKPGGHALVTAPQWNELHEEPHDYFRYTCYGLKDLFERNGFKTIEQDQRGGFFGNLTQMIIRMLMSKYKLHNKKIIGRLASKIFSILGKLAIWLDSRGGAENRKHAIGWAFVFQK
jgi:SAM-dependent methyltransferase